MGSVTPERIEIAALDRESAALRAPILGAMTRVLDAGRFILGPEVAAFEEEVGATLGGAHAVGCASGTDALVLALRAAGVGPGDEVIVPAFSFAATAEAVALVGVEPDIFTLDAASAAGLVGPRTRAIIPVHLYGQCARMEPLAALAARHELTIIEDAAQAIGAHAEGRPAGALGHVAAF